MSSTNHFCKVCTAWVNGNVGNIKRHELSDFHKANVQKQVKLANEKSKIDKIEFNRVSKELESINAAAQTSSLTIPQRSGVSVSSSLSDVPVGWVSLTDPTSGKVYLFNKSSGETRWVNQTAVHESEQPTRPERVMHSVDRPPQSQSDAGVPAWDKVVPFAPPSRPITSSPPPRAVSAAPPPRPATSAPPPRPQTGAQGAPPRPHITQPKSVEVLKNLMMSEEEASRHDPSKKGQTSTGFGDWEEVIQEEPEDSVVPDEEEPNEEIALFQKREHINTSFRGVKREALEEGADEPLFSARQIKKSSRTRRTSDD